MVLIKQEEQRCEWRKYIEKRLETICIFCFLFNIRSIWFMLLAVFFFQDGKLALDMALCFGRDFKSYDLVKLLKIMPTGDI